MPRQSEGRMTERDDDMIHREGRLNIGKDDTTIILYGFLFFSLFQAASQMDIFIFSLVIDYDRDIDTVFFSLILHQNSQTDMQ